VPWRRIEAGVEHFIARLEQRNVGADRIDDAGGIVAEDFGFRPPAGAARACGPCNRPGWPRSPSRRRGCRGPLGSGPGGLEIDQRICVPRPEATFLYPTAFMAVSPSCGPGTFSPPVTIAPNWQEPTGAPWLLLRLGDITTTPPACVYHATLRAPSRNASNFEPASPKLVGADLFVGRCHAGSRNMNRTLRLDVPVQRQRVDVLAAPPATPLAVAELIVEIHGAVPAGDFPLRPQPPALERERIGWNDATIGSAARIVLAGFRRSGCSPPVHSRPGISDPAALRSPCARH